MRILFTTTNDLTYDQRMQKICTSLANEGHDVKLIGRKRKRSGVLNAFPFKQKRLFCFFEKGKLFYFEYNLRLFIYLLFQTCDAICAVDTDTLLPCFLTGKLRGKKLVFDAHEYFTEVPELQGRKFVKRIWSLIERIAVPKMDLCYTVSSSLVNIFEKKFKRKFHLIRNVPVWMGDQISAKEEEKFILYQGALNKGRGLEVLIESIAHLPIKLKIAGEGDLSHELRKLCCELGLENKVEFLGWIRPDNLRLLTPKAFLGYNLLENESLSYYYSLSNKFFDYMHALVPSLSNNFPEYENINSRFEIAELISVEKESIINTVKYLLSDKVYYEKLKANCERASREYCWQEEEKTLILLYKNL